MAKPPIPTPMSLEHLMAMQSRQQAAPARRLLSDRRTAMLVAEASLLVALLAAGAFLGLAKSVRGLEAVGLGWLVVNVLWHYRTRGWRQLGNALLLAGLAVLLGAAVVTTPGFHSPIPHPPRATVPQVSQRVQAQAAELADSCAEQKFPGWLWCAARKAWADRNHPPASPTTTTPKKEKT
jgi:hypothetical protein